MRHVFELLRAAIYFGSRTPTAWARWHTGGRIERWVARHRSSERFLAWPLFALSLVVVDCAAAEVAFRRHVINGDTDYSAAAVIDVDHDGQLDIVCGGDWYRAPDWQRHFMRDVRRIRGRPDGFAHLSLDVNQDSWTDVITVNYRSGSIKWIQHPGAELGPWTTHIAAEPGPMETGRLVDVDGDGKLDLLPNGARFAAWWEFVFRSDGSTNNPIWIRHDLPRELGGHGLGFGDIDGDGRNDIVGQHGWLKAPPRPRSDRWRWHPEFSLERASIPMIVEDVDADGDNDIVWSSAHGFGVYWLEQAASKSRRRWIRHAIDTSWSQGHSPLWADLDGDGRNEFIAGKRYMSHGGNDPGAYDPIAVYRYQFDPSTRTWQRWTISAGQRVSLGLDPKAVDLDADGDLDLVASGRSGLFWLENLGDTGDSSRDPRIPRYELGSRLLSLKDEHGRAKSISNREDWGRRRSHIVQSFERTIGTIPKPNQRVPLDRRVIEQSIDMGVTTKTISFQSDEARRVHAILCLPREMPSRKIPGVVCLFDGHAAATADPSSNWPSDVALELAKRGYAAIIPIFVPGRNTRSQDAATTVRESNRGPDLVWPTMRAIDLLQSLSQVHAERIGCISYRKSDPLGLLAAAIDQRIVATLECVTADPFGSKTFGSKSRLAARSADRDTSNSDPEIDIHQLLAAIAPRAVRLNVLVRERDPQKPISEEFKDVVSVFGLCNAASNLRLERFTDPPVHPSQAVRSKHYDWLDQNLNRAR